MKPKPRDNRPATLDSSSALSSGAIREELRRILRDPEFLAGDKRRNFLSFIVEETLAGRADQLKGYTIARAIFSRSKDFDPANDPVVRVQAGKLRRELERYYLVSGGGDPIRIDIPKGGYVPLFIEQPEAGADPGPAVGVSEVLKPAAVPSVAVTPLANLTQDPEQEYFLDGLLSELTVELGRYQDIIAIPCAVEAPAPGTPAGAKTLASPPGARFILGGTLRKDADTAKVTVHLTDSATGRQLWSNSYKHRLNATSIIATQERIASDVVMTIADQSGIISRKLSRESRKKAPADLTTYEAMLRYHHYMRVMTPESYENAFTALRGAIEREPEYGSAWSALANLFNHAYIRDLPRPSNPLETATEYAKKGVILEPGNQLTRTVMAYVYLLQGDTKSALEEAGIALALNPNSPYFAGTIGYVLVLAGDFERGRTLIDRAIDVNPCQPRWVHHACWLDDYRRGKYDASYREALLAGPIIGYWNPALCAASLGQLGRQAEAKACVEELRRLAPHFESRAGELIRRTLKTDDLVERILDGLRKAGLEIK